MLIICWCCQEPKAKPAPIETFLDLKYGAFIHWTPATLIGKEVSFSRNAAIPASAYDSLYLDFNPVEFNADEWVKTLKEAGFRYLVFVPKHHDGFSMWNTRLTDYNIMHSPFGRDIIKEIANACRKFDLPLCLYYSIVDYYQPHCIPYDKRYVGEYGGPGYQLSPGEEPDFNKYVSFMKGQLKELTENYGPFLAWWFDGGWQPTWTKERGADLEAYMRQLQPGILLNHRVGTAYRDSVYLPTWFPDEQNRTGDYAVLEVDMPRFNRTIPWEYTRPANGKSYSWTNNEYTDIAVWVDDLVKSACGNGNFILGVSAPPTGRMEPKLIEKFKQMRLWLDQYGESLFETRGGPFKRTSRYGSTCRNNKIYLHLFEADSLFQLPSLSAPIEKVRMLNGGNAGFQQTDSALLIKINPYDFQLPVTILELSITGDAQTLPVTGEIPINQSVPVRSSNKKNSSDALSSDGDRSTAWTADHSSNEYWIEYDLGAEKKISRALLFEGQEEGELNAIRKAALQIKTDTGWQTCKEIAAWGNGSPQFDEWPISVSVPEIRFDPVKARFVRLLIVRQTRAPVIHEFELYEY